MGEKVFRVDFILPNGRYLSEGLPVPTWDELYNKYRPLAKKAGGEFDRLTRAWKVRVREITPEIVELAEAIGKDALEELRKAYREAESEIRKAARERKALIVMAPEYVEDRDAWRKLNELKKYATSIKGRNSFEVSGEMLEKLLDEYGPDAYALASSLARTPGIKVYGLENLMTAEAGRKVIKVSPEPVGAPAPGFYAIRAPPSIARAVENVAEALVRELGGREGRLEYYVKGIDRYGRPTTFTRSVRLVERAGNTVYVAPAILYPLLRKLREEGYEVEGAPKPPDEEAGFKWLFKHELWPFQKEAVEAWFKAGGRGVIVLPTGAGKTVVALRIAKEINRPTLILVPTRDLMAQWVRRVKEILGVEPAVWGGGRREVGPITITTYQSVIRHWPAFVNRFALVIADESHHEAAEKILRALMRIAAPYRLGITATPEREDGNTHILFALTGRTVYAKAPIELMEGGYLAPVTVGFAKVELRPEEREELEELEREYAWARGGERGRVKNRMNAVAMKSAAKDDAVAEILRRELSNPYSKAIVFVEFVDQAERLYRRLRGELGEGKVVLLHGRLKKGEREEALRRFREGDARVLVITPAGNEGLDLPDADVGLFVSFKRSKINFLQRLGRIMRLGNREGKVGRAYVIYTPYEEREAGFVKAIREYVDRYIPQDRVNDIVERMARAAYRIARREAAVRKEAPAPPRRRRRRVVNLLVGVPPAIRAILNKRFSQLTREEKIMLIDYVILRKGLYALKQDMAREARHRAIYVRSWLRNPARKDAPGIDTPAGRRLLRAALRQLKRLRKVLTV